MASFGDGRLVYKVLLQAFYKCSSCSSSWFRFIHYFLRGISNRCVCMFVCRQHEMREYSCLEIDLKILIITLKIVLRTMHIASSTAWVYSSAISTFLFFSFSSSTNLISFISFNDEFSVLYTMHLEKIVIQLIAAWLHSNWIVMLLILDFHIYVITF